MLALFAIFFHFRSGLPGRLSPKIHGCAGENLNGPAEARIIESHLMRDSDLHHYEYVFPDSNIYVYDLDQGFGLAKHVSMPGVTGIRGSVASAATGKLYVSYGSDRLGGCLLSYDLRQDRILWRRQYSFGIDSMSVTGDGKTIYMPTGELAREGNWAVLNAADGAPAGLIDSTGIGPHNTLLNGDDSRVYMAPRFSNYLVVAQTAGNKLIRAIGPVRNGVRPFTINHGETLAFITTTGLLGFQVGDITSGRIIYTVQVDGFPINPNPAAISSHGISLSPDEKEIYLIDSFNGYVHVFDVRGLPGSPPKQVANVKLAGSLSGKEAGCVSDCLKDGWIHHSRDGRYALVGDAGDVIDTVQRASVGILPAMARTRKEIEIDFRDGAPVWAMKNRSCAGLNLPQ